MRDLRCCLDCRNAGTQRHPDTTAMHTHATVVLLASAAAALKYNTKEGVMAVLSEGQPAVKVVIHWPYKQLPSVQSTVVAPSAPMSVKAPGVPDHAAHFWVTSPSRKRLKTKRIMNLAGKAYPASIIGGEENAQPTTVYYLLRVCLVPRTLRETRFRFRYQNYSFIA